MGAALLICACSQKAEIPSQYTQEPELEILEGHTLVFSADGESLDMVFDTDARLLVTVSATWISSSVAGNTVTLTAQPNASINARYAEVVAVSGGKTCSVMVQQAGKSTIFASQAEWIITPSVDAEYNVTVDISFAEGTTPGDYYTFVVHADTVKAHGAAGNLALFLSLKNNGETRKKGATVYSGPVTIDEGVFNRGKYYVYAVGLEEGFVNYKYACAEFNVFFPYDRWLGTWGAAPAEGSSEQWKIVQNVQDESYFIYGVAGGDELPTLATFDAATGGFSVKEQENVGVQSLGGEECDMSLYGCILYNGGHPYWGRGIEIFSTTLGEDLESGTVRPGGPGGTYGNFCGYAYYGSVGGSVQYWLGYKDLPVTLELQSR